MQRLLFSELKWQKKVNKFEHQRRKSWINYSKPPREFCASIKNNESVISELIWRDVHCIGKKTSCWQQMSITRFFIKGAIMSLCVWAKKNRRTETVGTPEEWMERVVTEAMFRPTFIMYLSYFFCLLQWIYIAFKVKKEKKKVKWFSQVATTVTRHRKTPRTTANGVFSVCQERLRVPGQRPQIFLPGAGEQTFSAIRATESCCSHSRVLFADQRQSCVH